MPMTFKPMPWLIRLCVKRWVAGITLPPFGIYLRIAQFENARLRAHESVHWEQYERMGAWMYYWTYLKGTITHGYVNHPMEVEAREKSGYPV